MRRWHHLSNAPPWPPLPSSSSRSRLHIKAWQSIHWVKANLSRYRGAGAPDVAIQAPARSCNSARLLFAIAYTPWNLRLRAQIRSMVERWGVKPLCSFRLAAVNLFLTLASRIWAKSFPGQESSVIPWQFLQSCRLPFSLQIGRIIPVLRYHSIWTGTRKLTISRLQVRQLLTSQARCYNSPALCHF